MDYNLDDDPTREYEMIWTLFQGKEEEEPPDTRNKEGITVKILKFLFGSGGGEVPEEPVGEFREKRRFHKHVYTPSPRHAAPPPDNVHDSMNEMTWTHTRIEGSTDLPSGSTPNGFVDQKVCEIMVAITMTVVLMLMTSLFNCLHLVQAVTKRKEGLDPRKVKV